MLVILNHKLNPDQVEDAELSLGVSEIEYMPEDLAKLWKNIPPDLKVSEFDMYFTPLLKWVLTHANFDDVILIMGESTATMYMIKKLRHFGYHKIYATTTKREVKLEKSAGGEVQKLSVFKHVAYREYP